MTATPGGSVNRRYITFVKSFPINCQNFKSIGSVRKSSPTRSNNGIRPTTLFILKYSISWPTTCNTYKHLVGCKSINHYRIADVVENIAGIILYNIYSVQTKYSRLSTIAIRATSAVKRDFAKANVKASREVFLMTFSFRFC